MKHTKVTIHPITDTPVNENPKTYRIGDCFLTERGVYQLIACGVYKTCLVHLESGNRRRDFIRINSAIGIITEEELLRMQGSLKQMQLLSKVEIRYEV